MRLLPVFFRLFRFPLRCFFILEKRKYSRPYIPHKLSLFLLSGCLFYVSCLRVLLLLIIHTAGAMPSFSLCLQTLYPSPSYQAFRPGIVDLPTGASEAPLAAINVQNFGQFDQDFLDFAGFQGRTEKGRDGLFGGGLGGRPDLDTLPMADQWVTAATQTLARRETITLQDEGGREGGGGVGMIDQSSLFDPEAELEDWGPFNPLDESMGVGGLVDRGGETSFEDDSGRYSDIELGRDAGDLSGRRSSLKRSRASLEVGEGGKEGRVSDYGEVMGKEGAREEYYYQDEGGDMMFMDDGDVPPPIMDEDWQKKMEGGKEGGEARGLSSLPDLSLGTSVEGDEEEPAVTEGEALMEWDGELRRAKREQEKKQKKKKPRLLRLDATTILSTAQIKAQLQDYDDICLPRVRPRDRVRGGAGRGGAREGGKAERAAMMEAVELRMKAPTLPGLSDDLQEVFRITMAVGGMKPGVAERTVEAGADGEGDDIEQARAGAEGVRRETIEAGRDSLSVVGEKERRMSRGLAEEAGQGAADEEDLMVQNEDFRMEDEDHVSLPPMDEEGTEGWEEGGAHHSSASKRRSSGLGFDDDGSVGSRDERVHADGMEDEDAGVAGGIGARLRVSKRLEEEEVQFVWHPNTVKILTFLRRQLRGKEAKRRGITLQALAAEASRANVAKFFWELLQLKTWDFVQLEQRAAYGEIVILPGRRFKEPIRLETDEDGEGGGGPEGDGEQGVAA